jgi:hypothetical protein
MLKGLFFLSAVIIALLVIGNIIQISFHPERFSELPGRLSTVAQDQPLFTRGRIYLTQLKRTVEQKLIDDENRRWELALLYIKTDAEQLEKLANSSKVAALEPQAQLLADSLERVQTLGQSSSADTLAAFQASTTAAYTLARASAERLQALQGEHAEAAASLAAVTDLIKDRLGQVAGTREADSALPTPSVIPLQF